MLFKLVLTFIAAAHCLPKGYKKHAKSAERLHALEKELDALKHVAEPQMERRGTCQEECEDAFGNPEEYFLKWVEKKYGKCPDCWMNMGDDDKNPFHTTTPQLSYNVLQKIRRATNYHTTTFIPFCKIFCKSV